MRPISEDTRQNIIGDLQAGYSIRQVAYRTNVGRTTVNKVAAEHLPNRKKPKGGKPLKLKEADKRYCVRQITRGGQGNAISVQKQLSFDFGLSVSPQTVRRALKAEGLGSMEKETKPNLNAKNIRERLAWAKKYEDYTIADWRRVIWSDETKINRFCSDGRTWAWIRDNEPLQDRLIKQTKKHGGGSIMIWSCISCIGVGWMCKIDSIMDKELYGTILRDELRKTVKLVCQETGLRTNQIIFQQDNDPKHTSGTVKDYLKKQKFVVMDWPSQSPDLNPIEHMWALVKRRLNDYDTPPSGMQELFERVTDVWYHKITKEECLNVIDSMPLRCDAAIKAKGRWTDY